MILANMHVESRAHIWRTSKTPVALDIWLMTPAQTLGPMTDFKAEYGSARIPAVMFSSSVTKYEPWGAALR